MSRIVDVRHNRNDATMTVSKRDTRTGGGCTIVHRRVTEVKRAELLRRISNQ